LVGALGLPSLFDRADDLLLAHLSRLEARMLWATIASRFVFRRIKIAQDDGREPTKREPLWLVIEWPDGESRPTKFFLTRKAKRTFDFRGLGRMGSLGRRMAVAEIFGIKLSGFIAWFI
jgi:NADH dehydrogenase FAD-containing subunit